jgi:hypothetical protein
MCSLKNLKEIIFSSNTFLPQTKCCVDHSRLRPTQALCTGFSTARLSGGKLSQLGWNVGLGCNHCSPDSVSTRTSYIFLPFLTFQMLTF